MKVIKVDGINKEYTFEDGEVIKFGNNNRIKQKTKGIKPINKKPVIKRSRKKKEK